MTANTAKDADVLAIHPLQVCVSAKGTFASNAGKKISAMPAISAATSNMP